MDQELSDKIQGLNPVEDNENTTEFSIDIVFSPEDFSIVNISSDNGKISHKLKSLSDLYNDSAHNDPLSLIDTIEDTIRTYYKSNRDKITDTYVIDLLDKISMKPEYESDSELNKLINSQLRLALSMLNYSRNDVRQAIRRIIKSAKRFSYEGGKIGYLSHLGTN